MKLSTYDRVQLLPEELGVSLEEARSLPWAVARVAKIHPSRWGFELEVGAFVGSITLPSGMELEVSELVPGTIETCIQIATGRTREVRHGSGNQATVSPQQSLALRYTEALAAVLATGPQKQFRRRQESTSRVRGRVIASETVLKHWSRGQFDKVVSRWSEISEDSAEGRIFLAAAVRADAILSPKSEGSRLIRACISALSGVTLERRPRQLDEGHWQSGERADALELARLLISGVPQIPSPGDKQAFSSWINVDNLFEAAVLKVFRDAATGGTVVAGRLERMPLFRSRLGEAAALVKRADPDVVVRMGKAIGVVDAKYRRSGARPTEGELYQLIAHADAFDASAAALVSPAIDQPTGIRRLGRVRRGFPVDVIAVDPSREVSIRFEIESWLAGLSS